MGVPHTLNLWCVYIIQSVWCLIFPISDPTIGSTIPKLHQLDFLEGNGRAVRVIDTAAAIWDKVALRLHFEHHDITRIERDHHQQSVLACQTVFGEWLEGKGRQPTSWDTLIKALREAGLSEIVSDLECVLSTPGTTSSSV